MWCSWTLSSLLATTSTSWRRTRTTRSRGRIRCPTRWSSASFRASWTPSSSPSAAPSQSTASRSCRPACSAGSRSTANHRWELNLTGQAAHSPEQCTRLAFTERPDNESLPSRCLFLIPDAEGVCCGSAPAAQRSALLMEQNLGTRLREIDFMGSLRVELKKKEKRKETNSSQPQATTQYFIFIFVCSLRLFCASLAAVGLPQPWTRADKWEYEIEGARQRSPIDFCLVGRKRGSLEVRRAARKWMHQSSDWRVRNNCGGCGI